MRRFLCQKFPVIGRSVELDRDEADHASRVLRLRSGDIVELINGRGEATTAALMFKGKRVFAESLGNEAENRGPAKGEIFPVTVAVGILKAQAMEWLVEKLTEIGVAALIPMLTEHSVVKPGRRSTADFRERWQKIADQSLKQCGRLVRLEVADPVTLAELIRRYSKDAPNEPFFWCEKGHGSISLVSALTSSRCASPMLLIGPEGGWSEGERKFLEQAKGCPVLLSANTLRAETAALSAAVLAVSQLGG